MVDLDAALARAAASPHLAGCEIRRPADPEPAPVDLAAALPAALARPLGSPPLAELARRQDSAVIVTADATRAVPTRGLLPPVVAALNAAGIPDRRINVIIGTGAHRPLGRDEQTQLLGAEWVRRLPVLNHDPRARDLVRLGVTPQGNELLVNRLVDERSVVVLLSACRDGSGSAEMLEAFAGCAGPQQALVCTIVGDFAVVTRAEVEELLATGGQEIQR